MLQLTRLIGCAILYVMCAVLGAAVGRELRGAGGGFAFWWVGVFGPPITRVWRRR